MYRSIVRLSIVASFVVSLCLLAAAIVSAQGAPPVVRIDLPERFRVLTDQFFDLRVEAAGLTSANARLVIDIQNDGRSGRERINFSGPLEQTSDNDNQPTLDKAWTYRKVSFATPGIKTIFATIIDGNHTFGVITQVSVQKFVLRGDKSIILFLGDAMGTAYRDAGRIVGQSTENRFRQGFFDELQQMDQMPVTGMSMTYSLDNIVPDSANTGSAWTTGNKTINGALNVFPDNNDFRFSAANLQATKQFALDNPRVETLWQYLKRLYGYKTGIVTTSDVTDATPAAEGAHTIIRSLLKDIARQYVDGTITQGNQFDVIMGGGLENFNARTVANSGDTRNLITELQAAGYTSVSNRTQLNAVSSSNPPSKLVGLFRTSNMNVTYDKLNLSRPADEPQPDFGGFTDQPFLDEMTAKAIATLNRNGSPFILMVEGASIDKQSHPNFAAGQIWDTIEFDKAVGIGRSFANRNIHGHENTLVLCTADHDQSMVIIGAVDTNVPNAVQNVIATLAYPNTNRPNGNVSPENRAGETSGFPDYQDTNGDGYPENTNRIRIKVGYRTGDHTGSSVPITAEGAGALLFFGYFDQTDIFFKMARVLSLNTNGLDSALDLKQDNDIPRFNPPSQFFGPAPRSLTNSLSTPSGVTMLNNAPLVTPRPTDQDDLDEDH